MRAVQAQGDNLHAVLQQALQANALQGRAAPGRLAVTWPLFEGKVGEDARRFLKKAHLSFLAAHVEDDERKVTIVGSQCLRGAADTWFAALMGNDVEAYLAENDWATFEAAFLARWAPEDLAEVARRRRDDLYQTGSVSSFINEFMEVDAMLIDSSEGDRMHAFTSRLSPVARQFVLLTKPQSLAQATQAATLFESSQSLSGVQHSLFGLTSTTPAPPAPSMAVDALEELRREVTEINAFVRSGQRFGGVKRGGEAAAKKLHDEDQAQGRCFRCHQAGHRRANCPKSF
jgi:hypothetical protein